MLIVQAAPIEPREFQTTIDFVKEIERLGWWWWWWCGGDGLAAEKTQEPPRQGDGNSSFST